MKPKKNKNLVDTLAVTESFGLQTFRRGTRHNWLKADDDMLLARLHKLYPAQSAANTLSAADIDWEQVAVAFGGQRKAKDCRKRWSSSLDTNLRRGKWTDEEDRLLIEHYNTYGPLWQKIASFIDGRTEHQCSKRYLEVLDPKVRNRLQPWSEAEDLALIRLVAQHGTKWKSMSMELEGRSSLTCRNRWRNLVTSVVRGKASEKIAEEMAKVRDAKSGVYIKKEEDDHSPENSVSAAGSPNEQDSRPSLESRPSGISSAPNGPTLERLREILNGSRNGPISEIGPSGSVSGQGQNVIQNQILGQGQSLGQGQILGQGSIPGQGPIMGQGRMSPVPARVLGSPASEHKYTISSESALPENHPLKRLLDSEGSISSQALVDSLVQCASQYNLNITIHQHHHYPRSESPAPLQEQDLMSGLLMDRRAKDATPNTDFYLEPEAQIGRFQHFNYLPPQTQVPKLTSSASSPGDKLTHHHHFHHHYHHHNEETPPAETPNNGKESNILKLLNDPRAVEDKSASLTPLTEAEQLFKRAHDFPEKDSKRHKELSPGEEALRLFEMQNLKFKPESSLGPEVNSIGADSSLPSHSTDSTGLAADASPTAHSVHSVQSAHSANSHTGHSGAAHSHNSAPDPPQLQQPVSQHHPLHYPEGTPWPEDEEDEEFMHGYGIFFNGYVRDKPMEPTDLGDFYDGGLIPFNPS